MSRLLYFVFSGPAVVWALAAGAAWLWLRPQSNWARRFLLLVAIGYAAASIYAIPAGLSRLLTLGYQPFTAAEASSSPVALVVLGASDESVRGSDSKLTISSATNSGRPA